MDKIARIRQEIKRRINILTSVYAELMERKDEEMMTYYHGKAIALEELLSFLDTLSEEPNTPEFPETFEICLYDGRTPDNEKCTECSTTCSVRKEEPDKSLEDVAEEWAENEAYGKSDAEFEMAYKGFIAGFENGKQAMKEQMLKDAVEGRVFMSFAPGHNQMVMADVDLPTNTKVRVIVLKEEEE